MGLHNLTAAEELASLGYLSLHKFVQYLREVDSPAAISYPTALKLVENGKLRAIHVGSGYRIMKDEAERFSINGNYEPGVQDPDDPDAIPITVRQLLTGQFK